MNSNIQYFINELETFLPKQRKSKVGRPPIPTNIILYELFRLFKFNLGWRNIEHKNTCRKYLKEIQRLGLLNKFFNLQTEHLVKFRPAKTIIDSTDIVSYRVNDKVRYSGKYHNYCLKISIEMTPEYVPLTWSLDKGTQADSDIFEKILLDQRKLPYAMFLDKAFEKYERRRKLKQKNCQLYIEMKKGKNKKRGPRFKFTDKERKQRGEIEKFMSWIKSFMCFRLNRFREYSTITAAFLFALNYYTYYLLN